MPPTRSAAPRADTTAPAVATGFTATAGIQSVTLRWNANSEADLRGYRIYRSLTTPVVADDNVTLIGIALKAGGRTFLDSDLDAGTKYYYAISPYDVIGNRAALVEASATPDHRTGHHRAGRPDRAHRPGDRHVRRPGLDRQHRNGSGRLQRLPVHHRRRCPGQADQHPADRHHLHRQHRAGGCHLLLRGHRRRHRQQRIRRLQRGLGRHRRPPASTPSSPSSPTPPPPSPATPRKPAPPTPPPAATAGSARTPSARTRRPPFDLTANTRLRTRDRRLRSEQPHDPHAVRRHRSRARPPTAA